MDPAQIQEVRRFNRAITRRIGALDQSYLSRGRPLAEARIIFETGSDGADVRALRNRLGLDSGYLSRLLDSLKAQGLVRLQGIAGDGRMRRVSLTPKGCKELAAYDRLSDDLAQSMLISLDPPQRDRLLTAMNEVERLIRAASVEVRQAAPSDADARWCLAEYFREIAARFDTGFDPALGNPDSEGEMTPPAGFFLVARLDGQPVGCGVLKRALESIGEVKRLWTAPSARGIGVARRVLRTLESIALEQGLKTLRLDTNRTLKEAQALYRSEGYREIERFNDNPYAHHWFEKRLQLVTLAAVVRIGRREGDGDAGRRPASHR
jgi:DNA-binding MarR family transcriptional regulator/GNAT superfamily N-acetyltransferase